MPAVYSADCWASFLSPTYHGGICVGWAEPGEAQQNLSTESISLGFITFSPTRPTWAEGERPTGKPSVGIHPPTNIPGAAGFSPPRLVDRNGPDRGLVSPTPSGVALSSGQPEADVVVPVVGRVVVALGGARVPAVVVPAAAAQHAPLTLDGPYPSCHLTPPGPENAAIARVASPGCRRAPRCCGWRHSPPGVAVR